MSIVSSKKLMLHYVGMVQVPCPGKHLGQRWSFVNTIILMIHNVPLSLNATSRIMPIGYSSDRTLSSNLQHYHVKVTNYDKYHFARGLSDGFKNAVRQLCSNVRNKPSLLEFALLSLR